MKYQKNSPKKSLGQNFLRDQNILKKIVDFADIQKEDLVLEIGPGEGTLTNFLLEKAGKVIVIEKDEELAKSLEQKFEKEILEGKLEVRIGDALEEDFYYKNYVVFGNIPYYITGALFKKFLESEDQPKTITFVVQKEVAERIIAKDGKESILSISVKAYGEPKFGGIIKAGSFFPKPKVDSAIIAIKNISKEKFEKITPPTPLTLRGGPDTKESEAKFFEILKLGFKHKRKMLAKNLEELFSKEKIKEVFEKCGIQIKTRAEKLRVEDWLNLTENLNI